MDVSPWRVGEQVEKINARFALLDAVLVRLVQDAGPEVRADVIALLEGVAEAGMTSLPPSVAAEVSSMTSASREAAGNLLRKLRPDG